VNIQPKAQSVFFASALPLAPGGKPLSAALHGTTRDIFRQGIAADFGAGRGSTSKTAWTDIVITILAIFFASSIPVHDTEILKLASAFGRPPPPPSMQPETGLGILPVKHKKASERQRTE